MASRADVRVLARACALAVLLIAAAGSAASAGPSSGRIDGVGAPTAAARAALRAHPLQSLSGADVSIARLAGEVVVLNFWASWCPPCRRELPALDALNAELAKHGGRVIAVSIDEERDNVERFVASRALGLTVVHDGPDGLARALDLRHVPLTLIVDRRGDVVWASSRSDAAGLEALGAEARRRVAERVEVADAQEGSSR